MVAYDPQGIPQGIPERVSQAAEHPEAIRAGTLADAAGCDVVVLAPPVQQLDTVIDAIAPLVRPGALVLDVASVKSRPVAAMRDRLPRTVDVVGLHPLFGPQSGRNGIRGLPIVVCPVRPTDPSYVIDVLTARFGLSVTVLTADAHDRMMAHVQALTHFVAAALKRVGVPALPVETQSYATLRAVVELVGGDAPELYRAIQYENPYAGDVRQAFVQATIELARECEALR